MLEGILTARDIKYELDDQVLVSTLMTPKPDLIVAYPNVTLDEAKSIFKTNKIEKLPLINLDGSLAG